MATEADDQHDAAGRDAVFEASPTAILVVERETGGIRDANEAAVALLGHGREQLCERTLAELCADGDATAAVQEAAASGATQREWELDSVEGTCWVDATLKPAGDGVLVFLQNLTERRELELDLRRQRGLTERVLDTTPTAR